MDGSVAIASVSTKEISMRPKVTPFLWFKDQAEEATRFYVSLFKNGEILSIDRMGDDGPVFTTSFRLDGQEFIALNGGPEGGAQSKFNESISFLIDCADQEEVDHFWDALTAGGEPSQCGWLKDKFGVTWQVVPRILNEVLGGPDRDGANRAMQAMMQMTKLDVATLKAAYDGV
jgi:predicted 3-demethylubiquinone-9 3-methyltransferase (glyoxalase superfamily)